MVFSDPLVFKCEVCGVKRQEAFVSIKRKKGVMHGKSWEVSVLHCHDNSNCVEGAAKLLERKIRRI